MGAVGSVAGIPARSEPAVAACRDGRIPQTGRDPAREGDGDVGAARAVVPEDRPRAVEAVELSAISVQYCVLPVERAGLLIRAIRLDKSADVN